MNAPSRRSFFGLAAATPAAIKMAVGDIQMRLAGMTQLGASAPGGLPPQPAIGDFQKIGSFSEWFAKQGAEWRDDAKNIRALDPDILSYKAMSLSAKIHIQRERNYQALLAERRGWFDRQFKKLGFMKWYND